MFRKEKFQYVNLYYQCKDTKECFTITEIDEFNQSHLFLTEKKDIIENRKQDIFSLKAFIL